MFNSFKSGRSRLFLAAATLAAFAASPVLAQSPPAMPAVTFPVDTASVVTVIVAAGATIMLLWFGPRLAFRLIRGLFRKLSGAVG